MPSDRAVIFEKVMAGFSATDVARTMDITAARVGQLFKNEYKRRHPFLWAACCIRDNVDEFSRHRRRTERRTPRVSTLRDVATAWKLGSLK